MQKSRVTLTEKTNVHQEQVPTDQRREVRAALSDRREKGRDGKPASGDMGHSRGTRRLLLKDGKLCFKDGLAVSPGLFCSTYHCEMAPFLLPAVRAGHGP